MFSYCFLNYGEDLTVVQPIITDTFRNGGKPQNILAKEAGYLKSVVAIRKLS